MSANIRKWDGKFLANFADTSEARDALAMSNSWSERVAQTAAKDIQEARQKIIAGLPQDMSIDDALLEYSDRFDEEVLYLKDSLADYIDD